MSAKLPKCAVPAWTVVVVLMASGCASTRHPADASHSADTNHPADASHTADARQHTEPRPAASDPNGDAPACTLLEREAESLIAANIACRVDQDCTVASTVGDCLAPFLCASALSTSADLDRLRDQAEDITRRFRMRCVSCALADCGEHERFQAYCEEGMCALAHRSPEATPSRDAGPPDPSAEQPVSENDCQARADAFAQFLNENDHCERNEDCAIVGDCGPNADFRAVRVEAADEAYSRMDARGECAGAHDGPIYRAICTEGRCERARFDSRGGCGLPVPTPRVDADYVVANQTGGALRVEALSLSARPMELLVEQVAAGAEATIYRATEGEEGGALLEHFFSNLWLRDGAGVVVYDGVRQQDWQAVDGGFRLVAGP